MAKFQIDENTWLKNYRYMIRTSKSLFRWISIFAILVALSIFSLFLRQFIGAGLIIFFILAIVFRLVFSEGARSKKEFSSNSIMPLPQEVIFSEESITFIFGLSKFILNWEDMKTIIYLPDLIYLRHRVLQFYILSSALVPEEWNILESKAKANKVSIENRRN